MLAPTQTRNEHAPRWAYLGELSERCEARQATGGCRGASVPSERASQPPTSVSEWQACNARRIMGRNHKSQERGFAKQTNERWRTGRGVGREERCGVTEERCGVTEGACDRENGARATRERSKCDESPRRTLPHY